jgi:PAS domain S-box-containing protein
MRSQDSFIGYLKEIASCMPGNFYWKDKNGVYLGCNSGTLIIPNYKNEEELIGKTDYDIWPDQAEEIRKHDMKVMTSGKTLHTEEYVQRNGQWYYYAVIKVPLRNANGEIVGVIGNSLDITDQKEIERLKAKAEEQKKFQEIANRVAHDIRTPLQVLSYVKSDILNECDIPEKVHVMLRESINSIKNILQTFLEFSLDKEESADYQYILVSQALRDILDQKELQYNGKNVELQYSFDPSLRFTFIYGNALNFERMTSNLLNNSVEAFEGNKGTIKIGFSVDENDTRITIQDNGKGMPQEIAEKLMNNESVSTTKKGGFGIGTCQIRDTIKEFGGKQLIESRIGVGTKITVIVPKSGEPKWAIKQIELRKGDIVVVLDDDILIHSLWKEKLKEYLPDITLKCFENGQETIDFINSFKEKDKLILLFDYELRHQKLNGLDVIQSSGIICRSILVSSIYNRKKIQDKSDSLGIKILPKAFIGNVQIVFNEKKDIDLSPSNATMIVLDNEKYFADCVSDILRDNNMEVDTYYYPEDLLKNLSKYSVDTKIVMDNDFNCEISGEELAKELFKNGFKKICLLTGVVDIAKTLQKYPEGTVSVPKGVNFNEKLLRWCKD